MGTLGPEPCQLIPSLLDALKHVPGDFLDLRLEFALNHSRDNAGRVQGRLRGAIIGISSRYEGWPCKWIVAGSVRGTATRDGDSLTLALSAKGGAKGGNTLRMQGNYDDRGPDGAGSLTIVALELPLDCPVPE